MMTKERMHKLECDLALGSEHYPPAVVRECLDEIVRLQAPFALAEKFNFRPDIAAAQIARLKQERDAALAECERLRNSLRNVMLLANKHRHRGDFLAYSNHLLRFCAEAGVVPSILRNQESDAK